MKKFIISCMSVVTLLFASCGDGDRIDQIDDSIPAPKPITVTSTRSIPGGAVIKVGLPNDANLKGVVAKYVRNGEEVETRISRYVDSLTVEGYPNTDPQKVTLYAFNTNGALSTPVEVTVTPDAPAVQTVGVAMENCFGGVKIHITNNPYKENLAVVLLTCPAEDEAVDDAKRRWVEITTLFTGSNDIYLTRRGLEAKEMLFGCYLRDNWGNLSDKTIAVLTPREEVEIDPTKVQYYNPGDDNSKQTSSSYPIMALWDRTYSGNSPNLYASDPNSPMPQWLTFDLGKRVILSRIGKWGRKSYQPYQNANPRNYEFWGSIEDPKKFAPNSENEHGFADCWFLIGRYVQPKPSGYNPDGTPGPFTDEDREYWNQGTEFEMDPLVFPHAYDEIRYLRLVITDTYQTWNTVNRKGQFQLEELLPFGQVLESYR